MGRRGYEALSVWWGAGSSCGDVELERVMKTNNLFVLIEGIELVFRRGEWIRVPTTILYTGEDNEFWEIATLDKGAPVLVKDTA